MHDAGAVHGIQHLSKALAYFVLHRREERVGSRGKTNWR